MKIVLGFNDIKKLIEDSYDGINDVSSEEVEIEIKLDVDGDTFKRKKQQVSTIKTSGGEIDYDTLVEQRKAELRAEITGQPIKPKEKTIEEKNQEAIQKGLMTSGRGSSRPMRKF